MDAWRAAARAATHGMACGQMPLYMSFLCVRALSRANDGYSRSERATPRPPVPRMSRAAALVGTYDFLGLKFGKRALCAFEKTEITN